MLDLTNAVIPASIAQGRINHREFFCERAVFAMQNGQLTIRAGRSGPVDFGMNIFFFARQPQELSGRKIRITTNDAVAPRVVLRWKDDMQPVTETFTGGYAMTLEFGTVTGNYLPGKIYICLPDKSKSYVLGNFTAEIRKPPAPKTPKR